MSSEESADKPWGLAALKLTASLVGGGWEKIAGIRDRILQDEDCEGTDLKASLGWACDIVDIVKTTGQKSQTHQPDQSTRRENNEGAPYPAVLEDNGQEEKEEAASNPEERDEPLDAKSLRERLGAFKEETSRQLFDEFKADLRAAQRVAEGNRLQEAEMALQDFLASEGDAEFLESALRDSMDTLAHAGIVMEVKFAAGIVAIAAGYVHRSTVESPTKAKMFTVEVTLAHIVDCLEPHWASNSTPEALALPCNDAISKTLTYLLDIATCVLALPPGEASHGADSISLIDVRLLRCLGALCASDPGLRDAYPRVGSGALRMRLEVITLWEVCMVARDSDVDIDTCQTKSDVIQVLLDSRKPISVGGRVNIYEFGGERGYTASDGDVATVQGFIPAVAVHEPGQPATPNLAIPVPRSPVIMEMPRSPTVPVPRSPALRSPMTRSVLHSTWSSSSTPSPREVVGRSLGLLLREIEAEEIEARSSSRTAIRVTPYSTPSPSSFPSNPVPHFGEGIAAAGVDSDREALMSLYRATGGEQWRNRTGWGTSAPLDEWYGVSVDERGRVTELELCQNSLLGFLPTDLHRLDEIKKIILWGNDLKGPIPPQLGSLTTLKEINLSENKLTGSIPATLGALRALEKLWLFDNRLTGSIPPEFGALSALKKLDLEDNRLSGPIPPELGALKMLLELRLGNNGLTGSIPPELGSMSSLREFFAHKNVLSGSIPPELGDLESLRELQLPENRLSGSIPPELGRLSLLQVLGLNNNELSGKIPAELGSMSGLVAIFLHKNKLSGSIPSAMGNMAALKEICLNNNELSGSIPPALGNLTYLLELRLGNNALSGSIPPEVGALVHLVEFYAHNNMLSGSIPPELGKMEALRTFQIPQNQLTGPIPPELSNLANLQVLGLNSNRLTGSIPPELGALMCLRQLYIHENALTGSIPSQLGDIVALQGLALSNNQLSGSIPPQLGNLAQLQILGLDNNRLTGRVPPSFGRLKALEKLLLHENRLIGSIPAELGDMSSVKVVSLSNNQLSGSIPPEMGRLSTLEKFSACGNLLSGMIPPALGSLTSLTFLNLSNNQLSGTIPSELANISSLDRLALDTNRLTGPFPQELSRLTSLEHLWLHHNNFPVGSEAIVAKLFPRCRVYWIDDVIVREEPMVPSSR